MSSSTNLIHFLLLCHSIYCIDVNSHDFLCSNDRNKTLKEFVVNEAFRYKDYIGLFGHTKIAETESDFVVGGGYYMVKYIPDYNPLDPQSHHFYEADVWPDLKKEMHELNQGQTNEMFIRYSFSANAEVLPRQEANEVVFIVYKPLGNEEFRNFTKAYEFYPNLTLKDNHMVVYNPKIQEDLSQIFNLKLLFLHFPEGVEINDMVILHIPNSQENSGDLFALVYTTEKANGVDHHMLHFLNSTLHSTQHYKLIEWRFDTRGKQCHKLEIMPNAVVKASMDTITTNGDESSVTERKRQIYNVTLIEFIGDGNRLASLVIDEEGGVLEYKPLTDKRSNLKILNCEKHPVHAPPPPIDCDDEKIGIYAINDLEIYEQTSGKRDDGSYGLLVISVLFTIIGIIILIAFGIFIIMDNSSKSK